MSETLFLSAVLLLLIGATALYFYSRIAYSDRKMNYLESILIDIRLKMELEKQGGGVAPIPLKAPEPLDQEDSEEIKDEKEFYNSVIETAAEDAPPASVEDTTEVADASNVVPSVDYESMSRDEVAALAEKNSIRVTKRMNKTTLISLLRESEKNTSATNETGRDVGASSGSLVEGTTGGAPLSME